MTISPLLFDNVPLSDYWMIFWVLFLIGLVVVEVLRWYFPDPRDVPASDETKNSGPKRYPDRHW
jgi:hypothetical protein